MLSAITQAEPLKTERKEFTKATKAQAFLASGGKCAHCGQRISGTVEYDHIIPCGNGGDNSLENCQCLCSVCHKAKTKGDVASVAKTKRMHNKANGIKTRQKQKIPSRPFPGSRASNFKKCMDGRVVRRSTKDQE